MKRYTLIILLLVFIKKSWTQNTNLDYKNAIKVYNLTAFEEDKQFSSGPLSTSFRYTTATLQILHPTIAFQWKAKRNNFHEIELTNLMLSKVGTKTEIVNDTTGSVQTMLSGTDLTTTLISVRYEYILNFNKLKDKKLVPSLGFGFNPYFLQNTYTPKIPLLYKTAELFFGVKTFITPRLTYYLSSKLFIDLNIPLCFFDNNFRVKKIENPALSANQRASTTYNSQLLPKNFSGRLGVGLKL